MDMVETVLPRATKVRIAGNNRTRPSLVGQLGYIKSGQSLGGWHEVVLEDGEELRVQRNALEVVYDDHGVPITVDIPPEPKYSHPTANNSRGRDDNSKLSYDGSTQEEDVSNIRLRQRKPVKTEKKRRKRPKVAACLSRLNLSSLRRYRKAFNLKVGKDCSKNELLLAVKQHFSENDVDENSTILEFIRKLCKEEDGVDDVSDK
ncbi:hypothetical protein GAYE_SCF09G3173 [Galdieria yellowstonensis]|uniref:Histone deacetylase complex subunit SAP30 Sin3 binding domain-containing protein n=1 Tax=Galdieria yellowstonensis TaxID=3028027 RepID=A0AAV9ICT9_9RHOD|nr:hypothetical protein GAYE_SCF09G3173 [Galdieria yellowstonensis]